MVNKTKLKKFLKEVSLPVALIIIYFILFSFQKVVSLPSQDQALDSIFNFLNAQSFFIIFLIALLEGSLILGQYAPGGLIIFLSIISAGTDIPRIILLVLVISLAFMIAYSIDYLIGYYGINTLAKKFGLAKYIARYKTRLESNQFSTIFFTYWETNLASLVAVAAGSLRTPFKKFFMYSLAGVLFWNTFWAILLVLFGSVIIRIFGYQYLLVLVVVWIVFIFYKNFIKKGQPENKTVNL